MDDGRRSTAEVGTLGAVTHTLRVVLLLVLLLAAGCSSAGEPPDAAGSDRAPSDTGSALAPAWSRADLRPVGRPQAVAGVVLLYTEAEGVLRLTALDPADGSTRWQTRATPSRITGGVELSVTTDDGTVFYLQPGRQPGTAVLVAAEAATGRPLWKDERAALFAGMPSACEDDESSLCALGVSELGEVALRFAKADGSRSERERSADLSREIGAGLVDPGDRDPHLVERADPAGRTLWSRPAAEVFGVPDATSDTGWYLVPYGELTVGHLGRGPVEPGGDPSSGRDLATGTVLAGIQLADGVRRWSDPGASYRCIGTLDELLPEAEPPLPFRCRSTGTLRFDPDGGEAELSADARTVVEGFDPATGATTWSADVGRVPALAFGAPSAVALGGTRVVLPDGDGGRRSLDQADGTLGPVEGDEPGWCLRSLPDARLVGLLDPQGMRVRSPQPVPCRADGAPLPAPATLDPALSAVVDGTSVWADESGVHAAVG